MFTKVQQRLHHFERPVVMIALTVIIVSLAGHILTAPLDHDEHMYLTAATLLSDHSIYTDFSYFQTPLMPYVYRAVLAFPGSDWILLTGRLLKIALAALLVLAIYSQSKRITGNRWIALGLLLFFVHNDVPRFTLALARNYDLPLLLTVLVVWLLAAPPARLARAHSIIPVLLAGMLATLSVGFKLTYAVVPLALGAALLVIGPRFTASIKRTATFAVGGLIGLLPLLAVFLTTPRDLFLFNNLGYHDLNTLWRLEHAPLATMTFAGKLTALGSELSDNNSLALLLVVGIMTGIAVVRRRPAPDGSASRAHPSAEATGHLARVGSANTAHPADSTKCPCDPRASVVRRPHPSAEATGHLARVGSANAAHPSDSTKCPCDPRASVVRRADPPIDQHSGLVPVISRRSRLSRIIVALVLAGLAMVLVPTPSLTSYHALLILALVLAAAMLFSRLNGTPRRYTGAAILLIAIVMIVSNLPRDWRNLTAVAQPNRWTGVQVHRQGQVLHDQLPPGERDMPVFTLSPLYALEAGLPVVPELSAGVFGYRVAGYLSEQDAERHYLVSAVTIEGFLNRYQPAMLLTGFEGELESDIEAWATTLGYMENRTLIPGATVYLAP